MLTSIYSKITFYLSSMARIGSRMYAEMDGATLAYVYVLAMLLIFIKFWWKWMDLNKKGEKVEGFLKTMRMFGADIAIAVLVVSGGVIPNVIAAATPHPWPLFEKLGHAIATVGDNLLEQGKQFASIQMGGKLADYENRAKAYNTDPKNTNKVNVEEVGKAFRESQSAVKASRDALAQKESDKQTRRLAKTVWATKDEDDLKARRGAYNIDYQKFQETSKIYKNSNEALAKWENAEAARAKKEKVATREALDTGWDALAGTPMAALGGVAALAGKVVTKIGFGVSETVPTAWEIISHVGYYACLLPAIIGFGFGLMSIMKSAIGAAQTGLKLQIIRNISLGLASIFSPLFFMCFLFPKTEQFGWRLVSFLFSVFLGFYGLSYLIGIAGPMVTSLLNALVVDISINVASSYAKEASFDLFLSSAHIGMWAVGIGMTADFMVQTMKSGISAGTSLMSGGFNAN